MTKPDQQGPQDHAEGQQGARTRQRFQDEISEFREVPDPILPEDTSHREGKHRLEEDREQHDEADKNSDRNRQRR
jgi:hypothetical protein